jgi:signal transduction histidine kinase
MRLLAHDLRGPFSAILGYSNLLVKNFDKYSNQKIGEQLAITNKVLHKTYNLLDNMLLWAKSQSGILPYEPRMVIAEDMCVEVVSFLKESANNKKIDIFLTDTSRTNIFADPDLLQIVLRNLLSNAIKFTHNGGEIYISINQKDNFAEISFLDNGIGICPKNLNNLWNPSSFFTTLGTDKEMGTGLGLLLCKEFVVKNGGQIRVESQEGKGSNFIFTVPLQGK